MVADARTPAAQRFASLVADAYELAGELERNAEKLARSVGQSAARWKVLSAASVGGQTVPQLARRLGLTRQSVQRVGDALEADGLVRYQPNPDHQRSPRMSLTARGERELELLSAAAAQWEDPLAARLPRAEMEQARAFIQALLAAIREHPPRLQPRRRS
jgi:DNA-binding MarR family transcriptional regulator